MHLRPDDTGGHRRALLHGSATSARYLRGRRRARASRSSASPSTSTASGRRSTSGATRSGRRTRSTTWTPTSTSCCDAEPGTLKLGIEMDFVPGREEQIAALLEGRAVGLRHRLGPLHRRPRRRPRGLGRLAAARRPDKVWTALLRDARRRRRQRAVRRARPPRPGEGLGPRPAAPTRDLRALLRAGDGGDRRVRRSRSRCRPRAAQAGRRDLPVRRAARDVRRRRASPVALSSDAHEPEHLGFGYDRGDRAASPRPACDRICVFGSARRRRWSRSDERPERRCGIGYDSHRFGGGRPLVLGGVEIPGELGSTGHSDADVVAHAVIDACSAPPALGDIGEHFPDTDEPLAAAPTRIELLREASTAVAEPGWHVVNVDATRDLRAPAARRRTSRAMARAARRRARARAAAVNIKAKTQRGNGLRRPRRGDRRARGGPARARRGRCRGGAPRTDHARRARRSAARAARSRPRVDLRLRADRLRPHPRRQRAAVRRLRAAQALPRARGLRGDAGREHHRHQRQDLRRRARRPGVPSRAARATR